MTDDRPMTREEKAIDRTIDVHISIEEGDYGRQLVMGTLTPGEIDHDTRDLDALDRFAAAALTGLVTGWNPPDAADFAYQYAEAMMEVRAKSHEAHRAIAEGREPEGVIDLRDPTTDSMLDAILGPWCRDCVPGEEEEDQEETVDADALRSDD